MHPKNTTLIDKKALLEMIPLAERAIDRLEKEGEFPRRMALPTTRLLGIWPRSRRGLNRAEAAKLIGRGPELWRLTYGLRSEANRAHWTSRGIGGRPHE